MKRCNFLFALILLIPILSRADSPITSTHFCEVYMDVPMVSKALESGVVDEEIAKFLSSPENPIDIKAAVINAIGWKLDGKNNAELYKEFLRQFHGEKITSSNLDILTDDEIFCLGYLTVMDDYFQPKKAIPILKKAAAKNRKSFTVAIILAITESQKAMSYNWCTMWLKVDKVLKNKKLNRDMREDAINIILDYMTLYMGYCR